MKLFRIVLTALLGLLFLHQGVAATRYWQGGSSSGNWNDPQNWKSSSTGNVGASVPSISDDVIFDAGSNPCVLNVLTDMRSLTVQSGYTGQISGTTFNIGVRDNFVLDGGPGFKFISTTARINLYHDVTITDPSMFESNGGIVFLVGTQGQTITCSPAMRLHDLWVGNSSGNSFPNYVLSSGTRMDVGHDLFIRGSRPIRFEGDVWVYGNVEISNTAVPNGGTVRDFKVYFKGSTDQVINSTAGVRQGAVARIIVDKAANSTLTFNGAVTIQRELTLNSGLVNTNNADLVFYGSAATPHSSQFNILVTGDWTIRDLHIWPYGNFGTGFNMATGNTMTVERDFYTYANRRFGFGQGDIRVKGNMYNQNVWGTLLNYAGNGNIIFDGTGDQVFVSNYTNSGVGKGFMPNIIIEKPSGTFTIEGSMTVQRDFKYIYDPVNGLNGVFDGVTNDPTLCMAPLANSSEISGSSFEIGNLTYIAAANMIATNGTIDPATTVTVKNLFNIRSTGVRRVSLYGGRIKAEGDVVINNTFNGSGNAGDAWIEFSGTDDQLFDGAGENVNRLPNIRINKISGNVIVTDAPSIDGQVQFLRGNFVSPVTPDEDDILVLNASSSVSRASNSSYAEVRVKKRGSTAFEFPVGRDGNYQPIGISAPSASTDAFVAEYFRGTYNDQQAAGEPVDVGIEALSDCEYWFLDRVAGTSNVEVTLNWDETSCNTSAADVMLVSRWEEKQWSNEGNTFSKGTEQEGVVTSVTQDAYGFYTLASSRASIITTSLTEDFCNVNLKELLVKVTAISVEQASAYRFTFENKDNARDLLVVEQDGPVIVPSDIEGILYGTTYNVTVQWKDENGVWSPAGEICSITTPVKPLIKLAEGFCDIRIDDLESTIVAETIKQASLAGTDSKYRFRFVNEADERDVVVVESSSEVLGLAKVAGIAFGKTYLVRVAWRDASGNWSEYGTACKLEIIPAPTTQLKEAFCASFIDSLNTIIEADPVAQASFAGTSSRYRFTFTNTLDPTVTHQAETADPSINLTTVTGLQYNSTYYVEVEWRFTDGQWQQKGAICQIVILENPEGGSPKKTSRPQIHTIINHGTCENPLASLTVNAVSDNVDHPVVSFTITDQNGNVIHNDQPDTYTSIFSGTSLAPGVYTVTVSNGIHTETEDICVGIKGVWSPANSAYTLPAPNDNSIVASVSGTGDLVNKLGDNQIGWLNYNYNVGAIIGDVSVAGISINHNGPSQTPTEVFVRRSTGGKPNKKGAEIFIRTNSGFFEKYPINTNGELKVKVDDITGNIYVTFMQAAPTIENTVVAPYISGFGDVTFNAHLEGGNSGILNMITSFDCKSTEERVCNLEIETSTTEICAGAFLPLNAVIPSGFSASDYSFLWTPSTDITCASCPNTVVYPSVNTTYTLNYEYLASGLKCPTPPSIDITILPEGDCESQTEADPIVGCCFGNFGAGVYVAEGTNVNVYCNLLNDLGTSETNLGPTLEHGQFVNYESINVKLDWIHNAGNNLYIVDDGHSSLFGFDQQMRGVSSTHYHNLTLDGTGVKEIEIDEYATHSLDLTDNQLAATNHTFFVTNTDPAAISRANGFVSTNDEDGYLDRSTISGTTYLYPMGSTVGTYRYRPVEVEGANSSDEFAVHFDNEPIPVTLDPNTKAPSVLNVHDQYYYKFFSAGLAEDWTITTYYNPLEGAFQSIAHWSLNNQSPAFEWWTGTPGSSGNYTASTDPNTLGLFSATTDGIQSFDTRNFALSDAGFYVGTDDFGGGGTDTDGDGIDDDIDVDIDGDGIPNDQDSDPYGTGNPTGGDSDGDGILDPFDVDNTGGMDLDGNGIDDQFDNINDADGDGIDDQFDVDFTGGNDTNGDGIDDSFQDPNEPTITVTSPGGTSTGGGLNEPNGTGNDVVLTPTPLKGNYEIEIVEGDCGVSGKISFEVLNDGSIDPNSVFFHSDLQGSEVGLLSPELYEVVSGGGVSGILPNSAPADPLEDCINSLTVSMGAGQSGNDIFILNRDDLTGQVTENVEMTSIEPTIMTGAAFTVYDKAGAQVYTSPVTVGGTGYQSLISGTVLPEGPYQFELTLTGVTQTVEGQFIIKNQ